MMTIDEKMVASIRHTGIAMRMITIKSLRSSLTRIPREFTSGTFLPLTTVTSLDSSSCPLPSIALRQSLIHKLTLVGVMSK